MSVTGRLRTGVRLAGQSASVLQGTPRLMIYPLVGGLAIGAFVLTAVGGLVATDGSESLAVTVGTLLLAYAGASFLASFSIAALSWATRESFAGRDPSVSAAFRAAAGHLPALLSWALLSALVGIVLRSIEESSDIVGTIISALLSLGWSALTYFVIPVVVFEDAGPTTMLQESAGLVRDTWGEAIGSEFGVGIVSVLLALPGVAVLAATLLFVEGGELVGLGLIGGGVLLAAGLVAGYTLSAIVKVALYAVARDDATPDAFDEDLVGLR
jgi:hypothetical protein